MRQHRHTTVSGPTGPANFSTLGYHIHKLPNGWTGPNVQTGPVAHYHEVRDPDNIPIISKTGMIIDIVAVGDDIQPV